MRDPLVSFRVRGTPGKCFLTAAEALLLGVIVLACQAAEDTPAAAAQRQLLPAIDLRPELERFGLVPRQQGARPTCSAFTVTSAIEFAAAKKEGKGPRLSVEFLNWAANQVNGQTNDGDFFSELWNGFSAHGICPEEQMPYRPAFDPASPPTPSALAQARPASRLGAHLHWIKEWNVNTGLTGEQFVGVKRTLNQGWPVCGGFRWPKQEKWSDGVLEMCPPDAVRDGHSVLLVGYRDESSQPGGGVFIFRNTAGDGRDGAMPYAWAMTYMNDAVWIDYEDSGAKPKTTIRLPEANGTGQNLKNADAEIGGRATYDLSRTTGCDIESPGAGQALR